MIGHVYDAYSVMRTMVKVSAIRYCTLETLSNDKRVLWV